MKFNHRPFTLALLCLLLLSAGPATADMFDEPTNLDVLPTDISPAELRDTMRAISTGTGNRCSACHVGEVEADLRTYDFSLDDKPRKEKARKMITLTNEINAALAVAFENSAEPLITVTCATCHRGQARPEMIEDVLTASLETDGVDASVARYRELRERHYGGYSYDFSERMLMRLAETVGMQQQLDAAMAFVNLNLEFFPESSRSYVLRAQLQTELGDIDAARRDYEKALEIEPQSRWIRQQLDNLN